MDGKTSVCVKSMACLVILNAFEWLKTLTKREPEKKQWKPDNRLGPVSHLRGIPSVKV